MDRIRLIAALTNASLVLGLYTTAWGAPTSGIAVLELALAAGAGISTWYALRGITRLRRRA
jgi:hypothetical protein